MGLWLCLYHSALLFFISIHRALVISSDLLIRLKVNNIVPSPIHGMGDNFLFNRRIRNKDITPIALKHRRPILFFLPQPVKPVRTPVAILGSLGVCIYVPANRHWLISYSPIHLT